MADGTLNFDTKINPSGFQSGINQISSIASTGLKATTSALALAAKAIIGIGTYSVAAGSDFEASMSKVQAIAGLTSKEAGSDYDILKKKAMEVASTSKFTAAETADALSYMAMAGWQTEDMTAGLSSVVNLAAASGQDLASTSDILTDAITALGHTAHDSTGRVDEMGNEISYASHFADILATASSNSNTNVGLMGETFKYAASMAGTLGYSAEDTALAIGLMANNGIKGSMAGTALNTMMTRLSTNSHGARDAIEALGVSFFDENGKARDFSDVLDEVREATKNMTDEEKVNFANKVAGKNAQEGFLAILNASTEDYGKLQGAIEDCDGAAEAMAETMNDNLNGQLTMLGSQLNILGVSIYDSLDTPMKDAVATARNLAQQLQDAFKEGGLDGMIQATGSVLAQALTSMAQAAPGLINTALQVCQSFISSLLANKSQVAQAGTDLIVSLISAITTLTGDMWSAAIELFASFLEGIASNYDQLLESAGQMVMQIVNALVEAAPSLLSSGISIVSSLVQGVMSALPQVAASAVSILGQLTAGVTANAPQMIKAGLETLLEFSGSLRENVGLIVDAGLQLILALGKSLVDSLPVIIATVPTIVTNIAGIINDNAPKILTTGIQLIIYLVKGII